MINKQFIISRGNCHKLGATIEKNGVNFAFWSPYAQEVDLLLFDNVNDDSPYIVHLSSRVFKSTYYWHVFVHGIGAGQIYAFRVTKAVDNSDSVAIGKVLIDPYAKRILFPDHYDRFAIGDEKRIFRNSLKCAVVDIDDYDWGIDAFPNHSLENTIIYEMHVKGFTADKSSGLDDSIKGTYRGLIEKIPYLVELGITTVELMPIYQFDENDARPGMKNYWGYSPMGFFAPHDCFSSDKSIMGPLNEFRDMVKALHKNGIEVILDVVYNHTSEGDDNGPTYSFKGLDKNGYYIVKNGYHQNYSGCGNSLNANRPIVRRMIIESLEFWHQKMHVDGFRFDLASILTRDKNGVPMNDNTTLLTIDADYQLAEAKLIAEPWDAGGLYQLGAISGSKWREWNGQFRDDVRAFMRGDCGKVKQFILRLLGSPDIYNEHEVDPQKSINFVTCHDGFTLYDLVCYSEKHNFANGENNNDGNNSNYSANYGIEGPSDDKSLNKLRLRQAKNFMAITMLSYGTPMICMGDEVLRTQNGNNNAYCQDNEISYLKWKYTEAQENMLNYTRKIIELRRQGQLSPHGNDNYNNKLDNALKNAKIQWHGTKPFQPDWSDMSHSVGFLFRHKTADVYAYVYVNAFWEDLTIELPSVPGHLHRNWYQYLNTALPKGKEVSNFYMSRRFRAGDKIKVKNHSILMLVCPAT
ncbi:glycogen debranching protein GlgX [Succinivibrio dextrinosolvens]|uniref:glycogen debranching protein GlgX n=1 Tax=Succinivibrio dextrinosolvens TaxID=83771 RepID=UPI0019208926|nr:glycogen debranching protein GlgX [Succinivibrio dextrinosolvens]